MRTVKEVAGLTGISVRTLQYYDEIGVFKPTCVTDAGYRLLELLEKLERGEACMSFREFDLSEYLEALEQFRQENAEEIVRHWGSMDKFDEYVERAKENNDEIARNAVKFYGSVEKYTAAMKESLSHFSENMEKMERIKAGGYVEENQRLTNLLLSDITKDVTSGEVQDLVGRLVNQLKPEDSLVMDLGDNYWGIVTDGYLNDENMIKVMDMKYGPGASVFLGKALQYYLNLKGSL